MGKSKVRKKPGPGTSKVAVRPRSHAYEVEYFNIKELRWISVAILVSTATEESINKTKLQAIVITHLLSAPILKTGKQGTRARILQRGSREIMLAFNEAGRVDFCHPAFYRQRDQHMA